MEAEEQRRQMSQHEEEGENEASLSLPCGRQKSLPQSIYVVEVHCTFTLALTCCCTLHCLFVHTGVLKATLGLFVKTQSY